MCCTGMRRRTFLKWRAEGNSLRLRFRKSGGARQNQRAADLVPLLRDVACSGTLAAGRAGVAAGTAGPARACVGFAQVSSKTFSKVTRGRRGKRCAPGGGKRANWVATNHLGKGSAGQIPNLSPCRLCNVSSMRGGKLSAQLRFGNKTGSVGSYSAGLAGDSAGARGA